MKKIMCVIISAVMLLSLCATAFAAASELESVVKTAKGRLSIPSEFTEFSSEKYTEGDANLYELSWENTEPPESRSSIRATVLPSGEILSYYYRDGKRDYGKTGIAAFSEEEYKSRARAWLIKANPSYAAELAEEIDVRIGGVSSYNVNVSFLRVIDGIRVYGDSVNVALDKYTGEVYSMNASWSHPKTVGDKGSVIAEEDAGKILGGMAELSLEYIKHPKENRAVLMYLPQRRGRMVDAVTGEEFTVEVIRDAEAPGMAGGSVSNDAATLEKGEAELTPEEIANIEKVNSLLSKNELSGIVKRMSGAEAAGYKVDSVSYSRTGSKDDGYKYEAQISLRGNKENEWATVRVDAETGELKHLYTYKPYDREKKKNESREKMQQTAEGFVKTWASDVADKAKIFDEDEELGGRVTFYQNEKGIRYEGNYISVSVDEESGKILSFSKYWKDVAEFDSPEGIITLEEAEAKYVEASKPALVYIANGIESYTMQSSKELKLIYVFSDEATAYIDAKTGEPLGWDMGIGEPEPEDYVLQNDLRGHYAEKAVKALADNGIVISYEETFRPDEAIRQKEIAFLVECFDGGYRPLVVTEDMYKSSVDSLIRREIIKPEEKKPEAHVPREEAVTYLVRLFGYGNAAELTGIYKTGFGDEGAIAPARVGAVAIAKAIGLVSGDGKNFSPKRNVTRGELAVMLYNALVK